MIYFWKNKDMPRIEVVETAVDWNTARRSCVDKGGE